MSHFISHMSCKNSHLSKPKRAKLPDPVDSFIKKAITLPIENLPPSPAVKEFIPYAPKSEQISETAENQKSTAVSNLNSKSAAEK